MQQLGQFAQKYIQAGFSVVPTNGKKRPTVKSWEQLQKAPMTDDEATEAFRTATYIAVITGAVSGNLELIDIDSKYDLEGNLWSGYSSAIHEAAPELWAKLTVQKTQNGGYHIIYRCAEIAGNAKLASRDGTPAEVAAKNAEIAAWNTANPDKPAKKSVERVIKTLIETRGEGGYALVAPSEGYELLQGSLLGVQEITPDERDILFSLATMYNTVATTKGSAAPTTAVPQTPPSAPKPTPAPIASAVDVTPWDDFNDQHSALDLLNQITPFYEVKNSRDGKGRVEILLSTTPNGEHNASYYPNENKCFVFTTNTSLPTETPLNPFDLYVLANYGSHSSANYSAAASDLLKAGYGTRGTMPQKPSKSSRPQTQNPAPSAASDGDDDGTESNPYFRILGYDKTDTGGQAFYFFIKKSNTLVRLTPSAMTKNNLMTLAPLQWWERTYPAKNGMSLDAAVNALVQIGQDKGYFRAKYVRGRGAWLDGDSVVVHAGDKLIVDGKETAFRDHKSKYVYESSEELEISTKNPLSADEAVKLLHMCSLLNWERDVNATLLAGWCVVAPVCGVPKWRPHIWLTGGAGTGKSWTFKNIVRRMLGKTALAVQGAQTTEAGLRQTLQYDALPVVFDEADAESRDAIEKMQSVLTLMRAASAEDGGQMIKGGTDGAAKAYTIRSCFAYASINVQLSQQSDRTRVSILGFKKLTDAKLREERFQKLKAMYNEHITDEFVQRLQARTIAMLPTIIANSETFGRAVRNLLENQRMGDQLGILIAGAYSLQYDRLATDSEAEAFVASQDWSEERGLDSTQDELQLLQKISEYLLRLDRGEQRTVAELIRTAGSVYGEPSERDTANDALKRFGVKVNVIEQRNEHGYATGVYDVRVYVSNTAEGIKRALSGTAWEKNHNKILLRLEGATDEQPMRFAGIKTRAVGLPMTYFSEE